MYAGANSLITQSVISIAQAVFLGILAAFGYNQNLAKGAQSFNVHDWNRDGVLSNSEVRMGAERWPNDEEDFDPNGPATWTPRAFRQIDRRGIDFPEIQHQAKRGIGIICRARLTILPDICYGLAGNERGGASSGRSAGSRAATASPST